VDSDSKMDSLDRIASGLPILGRIHQLLSTVDSRRASSSPPYANYVDCVGVVESTRAGTDRIRSWAPTSDERDLADAADRLAGAIAQLHVDFGESPRQLVHGDYWDNNVLFCGGQVVLVVDLDFMGVRPRIDDLALTLYYTMYELDDPLGDDGLRRLVQLVNAYDLGASPRLSTIERAVLPIAIARQSLWSVAIWGAQLDDEETARGTSGAPSRGEPPVGVGRRTAPGPGGPRMRPWCSVSAHTERRDPQHSWQCETRLHGGRLARRWNRTVTASGYGRVCSPTRRPADQDQRPARAVESPVVVVERGH
jgi:Ser/Thr protein kinase RdoA (MazF antagonist)